MAEAPDRKGPYLRCTVDRFEQTEEGAELAVLVFDDGQELVVKAEVLPSGAAEGAVLRVSFAVDEPETSARKESIRSLQDELFGDQ